MMVYGCMSENSAGLGLGELCASETLSAREYRSEYDLVCVAE